MTQTIHIMLSRFLGVVAATLLVFAVAACNDVPIDNDTAKYIPGEGDTNIVDNEPDFWETFPAARHPAGKLAEIIVKVPWENQQVIIDTLRLDIARETKLSLDTFPNGEIRGIGIDMALQLWDPVISGGVNRTGARQLLLHLPMTRLKKISSDYEDVRISDNPYDPQGEGGLKMVFWNGRERIFSTGADTANGQSIKGEASFYVKMIDPKRRIIRAQVWGQLFEQTGYNQPFRPKIELAPISLILGY